MTRVLVVDDEAIITMQLEERLSAMGYKVVGMAACGEEAIARARTLKPEIVLMDIVMPGKLNGIAAAGVIRKEMGIPVIFITSYADDAIINEAKKVNPYGYIVKPFNELELKAAMEMALYRKKTEDGDVSKRKREHAKIRYAAGDEEEIAGDPDDNIEPDSKTVLLNNFYQGIILIVYHPPFRNETLYKKFIAHGIAHGNRILYAYYPSGVRKHLVKEFQQEDLITHRVKRGELDSLLRLLEGELDSDPVPGKGKSWQILIDFSEIDDYDRIRAIKDYILEKTASGRVVSGIIALNIEEMESDQIQTFSGGITKVIVSTRDETSISIANQSYPLESLSVVPHAVVEEIVRKSLEPLVLSILTRPLSGFDIVHEIYDRHKVLIPQSRIYSILYDLQRKGILEVKVSGKSKLYVPTEKGQRYIQKNVNEFRMTFQHIFGGVTSGSESISSKN